MSYILSEYERMENKRCEYMELFIMLESEINGLAEIASELNIPWEGDANKAYIIRFNADFLIFKEILNRFYLAGEILGEAIKEYQKNEGEIAGMIDALT